MQNVNLKNLVFVVVLVFGAGAVSRADPMGTAFTYQGQLKDNDKPVNDAVDFEFALYDAATGGGQVGSTVTTNGVVVGDGLFTVTIDFGDDRFTGDARWLEIAVQCSGDPGFTALSPRQPLTPTPYALYAASGGSGDGHSLDAADGDPTDALYVDDDGNVGIGTLTPSEELDVAGDIHASGAITSGSSITVNGTTNTISSTGDLELHVSSGRVLRLESTGGAPNVIGGYSGNSITAGVNGGTIGGGQNNLASGSIRTSRTGPT